MADQTLPPCTHRTLIEGRTETCNVGSDTIHKLGAGCVAKKTDVVESLHQPGHTVSLGDLQTRYRPPVDSSLRSIAEFNLQKLAFGPNRHIAEIADDRLVSQFLG
jgi:hypothetical protein